MLSPQARVTSGVTNTGEGYETDAIAMVVIGGTSLGGRKRKTLGYCSRYLAYGLPVKWVGYVGSICILSDDGKRIRSNSGSNVRWSEF